MAKDKVLNKISMSEVKTFKIRNRKGYAAVCKDNLTEGVTVDQALERMNKALKRMGLTLG
ncbi:MAG: hypothetical protein ABIA77_03235 [Candidatus Omnitrophota bacterium]